MLIEDGPARVRAGDPSLFDIQTAFSEADRRGFLAAQNVVAETLGRFVYLEVGSDLGASLVPPLLDDRCSEVISVDLRVLSQPDERGRCFPFEGNTTTRMIETLAALVPPAQMAKLRTFDADVSTLTDREIDRRVRFALIDAEHTNRAVFRDFLALRRLLASDAVVAFHDSNLIFDGLANIEAMLRDGGAAIYTAYVPDKLFVLGFGAFATALAPVLDPLALDPTAFTQRSRVLLNAEIARNLQQGRGL